MLSCFHFFPATTFFSLLRPSSWRPIGRRHVCNENGIANLGFLPRFFHDGFLAQRWPKRFIWVPGSGEKQRDSKYHLGTEVFSERNPAINMGWLMVTYIIWTKNHTKSYVLWSEGPLYKLKVISAPYWATDSEAWNSISIWQLDYSMRNELRKLRDNPWKQWLFKKAYHGPASYIAFTLLVGQKQDHF